jgi:hypothetical protein
MKRLAMWFGLVVAAVVAAFGQDTPLVRAAFQTRTVPAIDAMLAKVGNGMNPEQVAARLVLVHHRALKGGEAEVREAVFTARDAFARQPQPLVQALLGSLLAVTARFEMQAGNAPGALDLVGEGIGHLDLAVLKAPDNAIVRIVRCEVFSAISA